MALSLKRGSGRVFSGENWKLASESKWEYQKLYVPNGCEPYVGSRDIDGQEFSVFKCLDDDFFAQPTEICRLPEPKDPMEIVYFSYPQVDKERSKKSLNKKETTQSGLVFSGKNWKLAGISKWKKSNGIIVSGLGNPVGIHVINDKNYQVYKSSLGFVAIHDG